MQELSIDFTDKEITSHGGMVLLKNMLKSTGLACVIERCPGLPQPGSNSGYDPQTILESFIASVWCGANRFIHTEIVRQNKVFGRIFEWVKTPGQDVYKRYFGKFSMGKNQEVFNYLFKWFFTQLEFNEYTIDFDSSVLTRYGDQEGAKRGYNPAKRGRPSHHPIMAFIDDCDMVAHMWLRSGDSTSSGNFEGFIEETLVRLEGKKVGLVRLDCGFYSKNIFKLLESKELNYIVSAPMHERLQRK